MNPLKPEFIEREQRILAAAAALIVRDGYEKTTMNDIAAEAGVTRAVAYLHFKNKEAVLEALLFQETRKYMQASLEDLETNPDSGTIAGVFRSALKIVKGSPFLSAMLKRDQRVFGGYLRKPGNLFESLQAQSMWTETLRRLSAAGVIRPEVDPILFATIMNALSLGLIVMQSEKNFNSGPAFDDLMNVTADMLDRTLEPEKGADRAVGRVVLRQMLTAARTKFELVGKETP